MGSLSSWGRSESARRSTSATVVLDCELNDVFQVMDERSDALVVQVESKRLHWEGVETARINET